MNVLFRSDAGPIEGFTSASFRVAVSDDGVGSLAGVPEAVDPVAGVIVCTVDGVDVFSWRAEEREATADETETVTVSGRGAAGSLERAIVLPDGYPNFTVRTRSITGAPLAIWSDLLAEAQARGRLPGVTPTWTATEDSKGDPWTTNVTVQLDPGANLRQLLDEVAEVEGAEWLVRPDLTVDAAPVIGTDRSDEVVLFVGRHQVSRGRRESSRRQRQTVFLEASTGVSEVSSPYVDPDAGEIWLEGQDFADPVTRPVVAARLAESLADPDVEVEVRVAPDCGVFDLFTVGDLVGLDDGSGTVERVRVVGVSIEVRDTVEVELTLISEVTLRQQQLDRAIEAKADVQLAASTSFQRRHGLVTADKFLSGAVGEDVAISSENFVPAIPGPGEGWAIFGDGNAEFNDAIFRGDLQSDNYVPDVSGWKLDRDGDAEFANIQLRDTVTFVGDELQAIDNLRVGLDISDRSITVNYLGPVDEVAGALSAIVEVPGQTLPPNAFRGVTLTAAPGQRLLLQRELVALDSADGNILIASDADNGGTFLDGSVIVSNANHQFSGAINVDGATTLQGTLGVDNDANVTGQLDIDGGATVGAGFTVLSGQASMLGTLFVAGTTSMSNNLTVIGTTTSTFFVGDGSGLTNLPTPSLPANPTFDVVDANQYRFRSGAAFPRLDRDGSKIQIRTAGSVRSKGDEGFFIEDGLTNTSATANTFINVEGRIFRGQTSSRSLKTNIEHKTLDGVLALNPVGYLPHEDDKGHDVRRPQYGLILEDVVESGPVELLTYDVDGQPLGIAYDRVGVALIPYVRDLVERVKRLEAGT